MYAFKQVGIAAFYFLLQFPDCEGSTEARCQLARATTGQRFSKQVSSTPYDPAGVNRRLMTSAYLVIILRLPLSVECRLALTAHNSERSPLTRNAADEITCYGIRYGRGVSFHCSKIRSSSDYLGLSRKASPTSLSELRLCFWAPVPPGFHPMTNLPLRNTMPDMFSLADLSSCFKLNLTGNTG